MADEEIFFEKRAIELYERSASRGVYEQTAFLNTAQQSILLRLEKSGQIRDVNFFGVFPDAERRFAVFGSEDACGWRYEPDAAVLKIEPLSDRFAQELSHRDYLGAVLSLGIKRELTGDILTDGHNAYIAVFTSAVPFLTENLKSVSRTCVRCTRCETLPDCSVKTPEEQIFFVPSERIDCVIAAVFRLSRADAKALFLRERVSVNGFLRLDPSAALRPDDMVSVRGAGRFRYLGIQKETKKGRLCVRAAVYA